MRRNVALLLCLVLFAACRQESTPAAQAELDITLTVEPAEAAVGEAELLIRVRDAGGEPVTPAQVDVRGDMSHAGMVPVLRNDVQGADGEYRVPFEWTMAGDWTVEVTLTFADESSVSKTFELGVSGAMEDMDDMKDMEMEEEAPAEEDEEAAVPAVRDTPTPQPTLRGMGGISRGGAAAQTPFGAWQGTPTPEPAG